LDGDKTHFTLNFSPTAAVQQMKDKGRNETRQNRHIVVGMKASISPTEKILKG
jgi:hypothetical protein